MSGEEGDGKMKEANTEWKADPIPVQGNSQNTLGLVLMLIVCVASIFACFATAALCYRYPP